ncbi:MAG: hypothetical protein Q9200_006515 [Gallowayella weberi]
MSESASANSAENEQVVKGSVLGKPDMKEEKRDNMPESRLPLTDAFNDLEKSEDIDGKIVVRSHIVRATGPSLNLEQKGEALNIQDFQQLMKENGAGEAHRNDTITSKAEALIAMFAKQSQILEKYTKHLEALELETKQLESAEAVAAMVEQTNIQTEAMLTAVEDEEDFSKDLQQQLEVLLTKIEETLERLKGRLKRRAAAGRSSVKETASEDQAIASSSN